ncbi:MAG: hypothetical protein RLZZ458_3447 [Planctomycetota bacterium]
MFKLFAGFKFFGEEFCDAGGALSESSDFKLRAQSVESGDEGGATDTNQQAGDGDDVPAKGDIDEVQCDAEQDGDEQPETRVFDPVMECLFLAGVFVVVVDLFPDD